MTKILIIRLSSLGDIVLTTPVVRCLKQQFSGEVEIHYLIKKKFYDVIKSNPYITKFHVVEEEGSLRSEVRGQKSENNSFSSDFRLPTSDFRLPTSNLFNRVIPQLKSENFDYIIDLHHNIRSFFVKKKLGTLSFTVNKINVRKWLKVNLKADVLPKVHIVDRYLETIKTLGIVNDGKGLDYFIPPEDEIDIVSLPASHCKGYIAFVIGGNYFTKKIPVEKIISICKKINEPVILLGGKEDFSNGAQIMNACGKAQITNLCFNACGKYNINQSASLVRQARKVITHDTGLMHIAAAFKKEIISVWGNTIPEFGMFPYYGNYQISRLAGGHPQGENLHSKSPFGKIIQVSNLTCRPCTKLGFSKCPKGHFKCMLEINEDEIVKAAK
ncbi:MAG: glycosyltransferase family 9 protein [Sphingobacteriales bacterium]|nr:glycosyltransferase family 9 protein [Sphingobacteriales bacterium]